jgi:hypothetical protein
MSLPVVLRPEASREAEEARDYLETQRAGLGQAFVDRLNETLAGSALCQSRTESFGGTCAPHDCASFLTSFTIVSMTIESKCWPSCTAIVMLQRGKLVREAAHPHPGSCK